MRQYQVDETLQQMLADAEKQGKKSIRIIALELNNKLPFTTEKDHNRNPMCCKAMRKIFDERRDIKIHETPSGDSSTFEIEYKLPR